MGPETEPVTMDWTLWDHEPYITHGSTFKLPAARQVVSRSSTEAEVTRVFTSKASGRDNQLPVASNCPVHNSMQIWEPFTYKRWLCFPFGCHFQESELMLEELP